ncbi:MAG TPA: MerR family transcriptional regulator [Aldersonia sp.]
MNEAYSHHHAAPPLETPADSGSVETLEPEPESVEYTVQSVASRLGIAIPTLRSWNRRYGIGPKDHQPGRHRQYSESDIARLAYMNQLIRAGATPASAARAAMADDGPNRVNDTGDLDDAVAAAFRLDGDTLRSFVVAVIMRDGVVTAWNDLCRPLFESILDRRTNSDQCIDVEHAASYAVSSALQQVRPPRTDARAPVLLACTSNETHTLGLEALRAALAERGLSAMMIGASVPPEALASALTRHVAPRAAVLWANRPATARYSALRRAERTGTTVYAAGFGWDAESLPSEIRYLSSLDEAVDVLG